VSRLPVVLLLLLLTSSATSEIDTLSLHDALPIFDPDQEHFAGAADAHLGIEHVDARLPPEQRTAHLARHPARGVRAVDPEHEIRSEEHTSELQSRVDLVCRLLLEKKKNNTQTRPR